jgi:hypothetical protein
MFSSAVASCSWTNICMSTSCKSSSSSTGEGLLLYHEILHVEYIQALYYNWYLYSIDKGGRINFCFILENVLYKAFRPHPFVELLSEVSWPLPWRLCQHSYRIAGEIFLAVSFVE